MPERTAWYEVESRGPCGAPGCLECYPIIPDEPPTPHYIREETPIPEATLLAPIEHPEWWDVEFRQHAETRLKEPGFTVERRVFVPGDPGYADAVRQAFEFVRVHGNRRYSDSTLMSLLRAADTPPPVPSATYYFTDCLGPIVVTLGEEYHYDEETEVKRGGVMGTLALLPQENGGFKGVLAVRDGCRRKGVGTTLWSFGVSMAPSLFAWVSNANTTGQMFLLSQDFIPFGMNSGGAVRYQQRGTVDLDA